MKNKRRKKKQSMKVGDVKKGKRRGMNYIELHREPDHTGLGSSLGDPS